MGAVMVTKFDSFWEERPMITLLCAFRMLHSVTEGVLQFSNSVMHGIGEIVH